MELSAENLRHNTVQLRALLPKGCELMPVLKANAYGHGAAIIAKELQKLGIRSFCVATAPEGVELRQSGIRGEILVLGYTHPEQFSLLRRYRLDVYKRQPLDAGRYHGLIALVQTTRLTGGYDLLFVIFPKFVPAAAPAGSGFRL